MAEDMQLRKPKQNHFFDRVRNAVTTWNVSSEPPHQLVGCVCGRVLPGMVSDSGAQRMTADLHRSFRINFVAGQRQSLFVLRGSARLESSEAVASSAIQPFAKARVSVCPKAEVTVTRGISRVD